jgi:hypothetical protein
MLTIFSTPKPFVGHVDVIQRNAIQSWQRLHPHVEVILIGNDAGTAEVCEQLGVRHIRDVRRNPHGTKYLASIYEEAQAAARHEFLCHVNCDIVLLSDFCHAITMVADAQKQFLMAGRRWDVDIRRPLDFGAADWEEKLRRLALETNQQKPPQWIDYFLFSKGLYSKIPEFVIGRPGWDNWLLWFALTVGVPVVDSSVVVQAVHQNHDYGYHPEGEKGVWEGEEAVENYRLLDGLRKFRTLENATHVLKPDGLRRNYRQWLVQPRRHAQRWLSPIWFRVLNVTRPVRHQIGLRQKGGG